MAQHIFCEPNQANWQGIRPGIDGDQKIIAGGVANATTTVYTVPADKLLLLFNWTFTHRNDAAVATSAHFVLKNAAGAIQYNFAVSRALKDVTVPYHGEMFVPIECFATDYFEVYSNNATTYAVWSAQGILVDV